MDSHQRIAGALMATLGGFSLLLTLVFLVWALTMFSGLRFEGVGVWLSLGITGLWLLWCLTAFGGGLAAFAGRPGARRPMLLAAFPALLGFPFGTMVGVYTLWVYFREGAPVAVPTPEWRRIAARQRAA